MTITTVIQKDSGLAIKECEFEELRNGRNIILAVLKTKTEGIYDYLIEQKIGDFETRIWELDDTYYFLYFDRNIQFHDTPIPSGSPKSDARYYVWDDKTGLLLQAIPPYSKTSCNFHIRTDESFHNVGGKVYMCLPEEEKLLNGDYHVTPNQCHRLYTSSETAINIILMNPPGLGITDHYHPKKCVKELC